MGPGPWLCLRGERGGQISDAAWRQSQKDGMEAGRDRQQSEGRDVKTRN